MTRNACLLGVQASNQYGEQTNTNLLVALRGPSTVMGWCYASDVSNYCSFFALQNETDFLIQQSSLSDLYNYTSGLTGAGISLNTWYCFALVRFTNTLQNLYKADGAGVFTQDITNSKARANSAALWVGRSNDSSRCLNGRLAFVRVWARALGLAELTAEWASAVPFTRLGLRVDYPLQVDAKDYSGYGLDLTLFGAPSFGVLGDGPTIPAPPRLADSNTVRYQHLYEAAF